MGAPFSCFVAKRKQQKGSKSTLNELIALTVECKHYVKPKVYEALFRLLQRVLKEKCRFSMPRRVVLRTPTLCATTQRAIKVTVQAHFSKSPMPAPLQDLCKSVVSTSKRARFFHKFRLHRIVGFKRLIGWFHEGKQVPKA